MDMATNRAIPATGELYWPSFTIAESVLMPRAAAKCPPMSTASLQVRIALAYGCIYLVWGTTYLGIALAIRTVPPFVSGGVRFLLAAALMFAWLWLRDRAQLKGLPWRPALLSGVLLGGAGNGFVVWAQQGVPSGIAALLLASIPVVVLLFNWAFFERRAPDRRALTGTGLALAGVATIVATRHGIGRG